MIFQIGSIVLIFDTLMPILLLSMYIPFILLMENGATDMEIATKNTFSRM